MLREQQTEAEQLFIDLETKWMNGWKNKDLQTCSEILGDDFTLASSLSTGELMTKAQWLGALDRYHCKSFQINKLTVKSYGNVAIVTVWFYQEADVNGKDWNGDFLLTDVWVKNNNWQVVTRHASWLNQK